MAIGAIVQCSEDGTDSMIILDPHWLTRLMATLITSKPNFVRFVPMYKAQMERVFNN